MPFIRLHDMGITRPPPSPDPLGPLPVVQVVPFLKAHCSELGSEVSSRSWFRVILEKPFGHDLDSSEVCVCGGGCLAEVR